MPVYINANRPLSWVVNSILGPLQTLLGASHTLLQLAHRQPVAARTGSILNKSTAPQTMARIIEQKMNKAISEESNFRLDNTIVITEDSISKVLLYGNKIAEIGDNFIQLFDGGWQTKTTKGRLNSILSEHGNGDYIFQKNKEWFVKTDDKIIPFENGMILQ